MDTLLFVLLLLLIGYLWRRDRRLSRSFERIRPDLRDPCDQLKFVMKAGFHKKRVMNLQEYAVFRVIEGEIRSRKLPHRVFSQVCLGEVIGSEDAKAFGSINSKRADILIIDGNGYPAAAIEYQGGGHYQGSAAARDAVKREALRRAGVPMIEVFEGDKPEEILRRLRGALGWAEIINPVAALP